jgi:hypothetical protein
VRNFNANEAKSEEPTFCVGSLLFVCRASHSPRNDKLRPALFYCSYIPQVSQTRFIHRIGAGCSNGNYELATLTGRYSESRRFLFNFSSMRKFTRKQKGKILSAEVIREQVDLAAEDRDRLLKAIYKALGNNDYFWVKGCLWEVLRYLVVNPPKEENKWLGVRWLLSEMAKFAQRDFKE